MGKHKREKAGTKTRDHKITDLPGKPVRRGVGEAIKGGFGDGSVRFNTI